MKYARHDRGRAESDFILAVHGHPGMAAMGNGSGGPMGMMPAGHQSNHPNQFGHAGSANTGSSMPMQPQGGAGGSQGGFGGPPGPPGSVQGPAGGRGGPQGPHGGGGGPVHQLINALTTPMPQDAPSNLLLRLLINKDNGKGESGEGS